MNKKTNVIAYSVLFGILLFILDSIFFYMEFNEKYTFLQALFTKVPFWELLSRLLILTFVIIAGMIINEFLKNTITANQPLPTKTLNTLSGQLDFNFLSSLAFQIRTPLNAIIGFSELLKLPNLPAESKDLYINHVNSSSKYLLLLINNLSEISRIDSNKLNIDKTECVVNEIIEEIFPVFQTRRTELGKPDIALVIETTKDIQDLNLLTDPEKLKQIFHNLLENALINAEKGRIKLGYSLKPNGFVEFYIQDTGRGFSQERMDSIFERYNKLTDNQNLPFDGSVLRLAISKSLVKLLGGEIRADSKIGQGTIVYFTIPYIKVSSHLKDAKALVKTAPISPANWSDRLLLIAEDVHSNYIYLEELLKPTKIKIIWAKNGKEALHHINTNPKIELVLMDILMPEMDGYEASREIKKIRNDLPIIAQTACAIEGSETSEQNKNFDSYLTKPIWQPQLMASISKYLY